MNRAEFLRTAAATFATGRVSTVADNYQPVGRMSYDSPGAGMVDYITVDGERVPRVVELDDVEGWVRHYGPIDGDWRDELLPDGSGLRTYHRTGVVRVHWRERAAQP